MSDTHELAGMIDRLRPSEALAILRNLVMVADAHPAEKASQAIGRQIRAHHKFMEEPKWKPKS